MEWFSRGRLAETHGLGIAAFAYYRRMVEDHKNRLIDTLLDVATKLEEEEFAKQLREARSETQFDKAMKFLAAGIPQSLKILDQKPLAILHSLASEAIHELTDEEALALATNTRILLAELAERMALALRDTKEGERAMRSIQTHLAEKARRRAAADSTGKQ
jgi:hypothetical protein